MNESMAIAEGQSTNQTGQATPDVHDEVYTGHNNQKKQHSQMMNNPNQPLTYMYYKSRLIFNSNEIPVCSTPCQLLNCIHPENENFSYSPAPPPPREGGLLPGMGHISMCCCEGCGFQAVYSGIGYINQRVWI